LSITVSFENNIFALDKLQLPTRYYYFNDVENYVKLLSIGEGIFPKDKIKTKVTLNNSNAILTTESATKIYPSKKEFGINKIDVTLQNSNFEFINDELILFKDAKLLQLLKIKADKKSTFFYADILSHGRSYEDFDFDVMSMKNSFFCEDKLEYLEKYNVSGDTLKNYIKDNKSKNNIFAKIYIKTNNDMFLEQLQQSQNKSFSYTQSKKLIIGVISANNMSILKKKVLSIWTTYRAHLDKKEFNLGKQ